MEGLHETGLDLEVIESIQVDIDSADILEKEKSLLRLSEVLTAQPSNAASIRETVQQARACGWDDVEIANAVFLVSYFNMVTRIAVGFNLPPDHYHSFSMSDTIPLLPIE